MATTVMMARSLEPGAWDLEPEGCLLSIGDYTPGPAFMLHLSSGEKSCG